MVATGFAAGQEPAFEVVSVKPQTGPRFGGVRSASRFYEPSVFLRYLVEFAYDLPPFRVLGGPDWVDRDRWVVDARTAAPVPADEMRLMVRRLLRDRFGLRAHLESHEQPIYELHLAREDGKLGPGLRPARGADNAFPTGKTTTAATQPVGMTAGTVSPSAGGGSVTVTFRAAPLSALAAHLERVLKRVVSDETGLTGMFDLELMYFYEGVVLSRPSLGQLAKEKESPVLFTALREQLGLKLEPSRGAADVLVIDSVERPNAD